MRGLESIAYICSGSAAVASGRKHFEGIRGARVVFAIEDMGTRVAMVELADGPPHLVLAGHLDGERAVLLYRVASMKTTLAGLKQRVWKK